LNYFIAGLLAILSCVSAAIACDVIDDTGHALQLKQPAKRIITLAPDVTEMVFAIGAGASVVGVASSSDYPPETKKIPVVASYNHWDSEALLKLHPDLIIAEAGLYSKSQFQLLRYFGIPVFLSAPHDLMDIPRTLSKLGCLTGTEHIADRQAADFSKQVTALRQRYAHKKTVSVFFEVWSHPLITVNKKSWINQIITDCGGKNIFADASNIAPEVSLEAVVQANPDVIITTTNPDKTWYTWSRLAAVANHHVFFVNPDWVERAGPRLLEGAKMICQAADEARNQSDNAQMNQN
jgi:iron complex transport system substrate-binding protein